MDIGMVKTEKLTTEKIIKAVRGSAGIKASLARKLNVHRHTIDAYEKKYVNVRQAIEEERNRILL